MNPITIEAAHGRRLIAVVVPNQESFAKMSLEERMQAIAPYCNDVLAPALTSLQKLNILGTLHYDGKKWVSSFDVEPFVEGLNLSPVMDTLIKLDTVTRIQVFIALLNSYGVGYLTNPLGEKPDEQSMKYDYNDGHDVMFDNALYNHDVNEWLKAEEGVLKPNQQIVFIEQLNP